MILIRGVVTDEMMQLQNVSAKILYGFQLSTISATKNEVSH